MSPFLLIFGTSNLIKHEIWSKFNKFMRNRIAFRHNDLTLKQIFSLSFWIDKTFKIYEKNQVKMYYEFVVYSKYLKICYESLKILQTSKMFEILFEE